MSRKNIILTVIIVVMLGGAGYILYRGFFAGGDSSSPATAGTVPAVPATGVAVNADASSSPTSSPTTSLTPTTSSTIAGSSSGAATPTSGTPVAAPASVNSGKVLPLGMKLDFTLIRKYNADGKLFSYPKVDPSEIGPSLNDILKFSGTAKKGP